MEKWKRGIGNDCHKIWDSNGRLVATVENPKDGTHIVECVNVIASSEDKNLVTITGERHVELIETEIDYKKRLEDIHGVIHKHLNEMNERLGICKA